MSHNSAWNKTFTTNDVPADHFLDQVRSCLKPEMFERPLHVLEVGCGDGAQLVRFGEMLPQARLMGVDISEPNIRIAETRKCSQGVRDRLDFIAGDYRNLTLARYDLIISDGTFHLIPCSNDELFSKLTSELKPNGQLLFTMPYRCLFNSMLSGARRSLRLIRSRMTDRLIMSLARTLHGRSHSSDFLRERVHYMYMTPYRYGSRSLQKELQSKHRLVAESVVECPRTSVGKLKHRCYNFRLTANS